MKIVYSRSTCCLFLSNSHFHEQMEIESYASVDKKRRGSAEAASTTSNDDAASQGPGIHLLRASSSSPSTSSQPVYEYDVFLSFWRGGTQKGFTDSLYADLKRAGIRVFMDNEEPDVGEEIGHELLYAIKHSNISIAIFSEEYAFSKLCLEELAFMMDCREAMGQIVFPVFYDVTPNEVQHQTGRYATAFEQHDENQDSETVQRWKRSLSKVGSVKGLEVKNESFQEKISTIITLVLKELKTAYLPTNKNLVGINDKFEAVMKMLALEIQDVRFVGIWGMVGTGKTTLAKLIYNKILDKFDACCFLQDIRESSTHNYNVLLQLQAQLVAALLGCNRPNFSTIDEGLYVLERRFREKKVLILLDDVGHFDQLRALAAENDWFGQGSRIIITTRNKNVLLKVAQEQDIYELEEVREDVPTEGGSLLSEKTEQVCKPTSQKLKKVPNKENENKLMVMYNELQYEQQQMFLDIASIFIEEDKRMVSYFWEDIYKFLPDEDIEILQGCSLIKLGDDDNRLRMHDQLRALGREIVRRENYDEPGKRSRLWGKEAIEVLQSNQGSRSIKAIRLEYHRGLKGRDFRSEQFKELSMLRFLRLDSANLDGDFENLLPELRWLQWKVTQFKCTATNLNLKNLLILDLSDSQVTHDWNLWDRIQMMAPKLKVLDLSNCNELKRTPEFHAFPNLERLNMSDCKSLELIDPSIGKLKHISFLNLDGCRYIKELPEQIWCMEMLQELVIDWTCIKELPKLDCLENLKTLSAKNCQHLTKIPSSIGRLTSLTDLILDESRITELPESIGTLDTLRRLKLAGTPVEELPISIGGLKSLVELGLSKTKISILPESIANLTNLEVLQIDRSSVFYLPGALAQLQKLRYIDASKCRMLAEISIELGGLPSLKVLLLRHTNIRCIPETIMGLSSLETLDLGWCTQLQALPELPSNLSRMSVTCQSWVPLPNLRSLHNLRKLELVRCTVPKEVVEIPMLEELRISCSNAVILLDEIGAFSMLKELFVSNINHECLLRFPSGLRKLSILRCHSLARLAELSNLQNLSELLIYSCPKLVEMEGLGDLASVRKLSISSCGMLTELCGLEMLGSLEELLIETCESLHELADLSNLSGIKMLTIYDLPIHSARGLSCLKSLVDLHLESCMKFQGLEGVDELESLTSLRISYCRAIERLPNLSNLKSLQRLVINGCEKLQGLEGLENLEALEELDIRELKSIQTLPRLSKLKVLEILCTEGCENLLGFEGLEGLDRMRRLEISRCKAIERLPDLSNFKLLHFLHAEDCEKLQLQGLGKLNKLVGLNIKGCKSIEKLSDLSSLTSLKYFHADGRAESHLQQAMGVGAGFLEANGIEKLQELDDKLGMGDRSIECHGHGKWMEVPNKSNLGILKRWYTDGCEGIAELEGLENLERFHLRSNSYSYLVQMYSPWPAT